MPAFLKNDQKCHKHQEESKSRFLAGCADMQAALLLFPFDVKRKHDVYAGL